MVGGQAFKHDVAYVVGRMNSGPPGPALVSHLLTLLSQLPDNRHFSSRAALLLRLSGLRRFRVCIGCTFRPASAGSGGSKLAALRTCASAHP
jgi:hypothetical protein